LVRKRRTDVWNERAEDLELLMAVEADEFEDNAAHHRAGISAEQEKFRVNETTTPKVLQPDKNE